MDLLKLVGKKTLPEWWWRMVIPLVQITGDSSQKESLVSNARRERKPIDRWNPLSPSNQKFLGGFHVFFFKKCFARWFKVTPLSPSWRSLNLWKGHLTIPKRSHWITWSVIFSNIGLHCLSMEMLGWWDQMYSFELEMAWFFYQHLPVPVLFEP